MALPAGEDRRRRRELGARLALPAGEERRRPPPAVAVVVSEEAPRSLLLRALADAWVYPPPRQLRSFPIPRGPARGRPAGAVEDEVVRTAKKTDRMVPKKNAVSAAGGAGRREAGRRAGASRPEGAPVPR